MYHIEKREWDAVKEEDLGDVKLIWIKRTPEEKGEKPYEMNNKYLQGLSIEDFIRHKQEWVKWQWDNQEGLYVNSHEYCKAQFLVLREIMEPKYRRSKP